jgi:hypothetical protein
MKHAAFAALAVLLAAGTARAETLDEITTKGMVLSIGSVDIEITFMPDGKFSAMEGALKGTWRVEGDKLCTTGDDGVETCAVYPKGKKSGDTFDVELGSMPAKVKIK